MARPQKLNDKEIYTVIAAQRAAHLPCTGVAIRRELERRFGTRAGTDRLYRLLRKTPTTANPSPSLPLDLDVTRLAAERDAALRRAQLAEYREEATQVRTAAEIDSLRERLRALGVDPFAPDRSSSRPFPV
jgi:hypothetical protein